MFFTNYIVYTQVILHILFYTEKAVYELLPEKCRSTLDCYECVEFSLIDALISKSDFISPRTAESG